MSLFDMSGSLDAKSEMPATAQPGAMSTADNTIDEIAAQTSKIALVEPLTDEPKPLTEFFLFMDLVPEVRLKIWDFAMPAARIIEVLWDYDKGYYTDCLNKTPGILHACVESRLFALERYTSVEVENIVENPPPNHYAPSLHTPTYRKEPSLGFYFNPSKDTLYLSMGKMHGIFPIKDKIIWFLENLDESFAERLQNLAAGFFFVPSFANCRIKDEDGSAALISRFPQLKSIAMVVSDPCMCTYWHDPRNFAPRREPLAMTELETRDGFAYTKWCSGTRKTITHYASRDWREQIPLRTLFLRRGLIQLGMNEDHVNKLQLPITEVIRGERSWDGLAQRYATALLAEKRE